MLNRTRFNVNSNKFIIENRGSVISVSGYKGNTPMVWSGPNGKHRYAIASNAVTAIREFAEKNGLDADKMQDAYCKNPL